jgi:hypothetical protein
MILRYIHEGRLVDDLAGDAGLEAKLTWQVPEPAAARFPLAASVLFVHL